MATWKYFVGILIFVLFGIGFQSDLGEPKQNSKNVLYQKNVQTYEKNFSLVFQGLIHELKNAP